jgi:hypothetical protein
MSAPDGLVLHAFGAVETSPRNNYAERIWNRGKSIGEHGDRRKPILHLRRPRVRFETYFQVGFQGVKLTAEQMAMNISMLRNRIAVEWVFKDVKQYFTHLALPRKLNIRVTPVGRGTIVAF